MVDGATASCYGVGRVHGVKHHHILGDSWTVPVAGALITTVLAFLLPYKLGKKAPILLSDFLTHNDFPITESEWSFIPSPGEVSTCSDSEPEPHVEPVPLPKVKPFSRTLTSWHTRALSPRFSDHSSDDGIGFGGVSRGFLGGRDASAPSYAKD